MDDEMVQNKNPVRIACVIGTRPEIIKMAPIIHELKHLPSFIVTVINTAQHRQLLDDMLHIFRIIPDVDLDIMQNNQSLPTLTGQLFLKLGNIITKDDYDVVLAQGDTTTTWVSAHVSFYHRIPFGHVEAGLRSNDLYQPFPEELNRILIAQLASWHFVPTEKERHCLLNENIDDKKIFVTGNTVIDSLHMIAKKNVKLPFNINKNKRIILVTLHRRESFGEALKNIFYSLLELVNIFPDIEIFYPVHPNPHVHKAAHDILGHSSSIHLLAPLTYDVFVSLMKQSYLIMTDSGGIQEEAPFLNKPILILREKTERSLVVRLGLGLLVGTKQEDIIRTVTLLLTDKERYTIMKKNMSPYGDGFSAKKIVHIIADTFK